MTYAAVFCFPGHGHVNPTLPFVAELVRRGEKVDYYCVEDFRSAIESTGARFKPLGVATMKLATMDPMAGIFRLGEVVAEVTHDLLPELLETLARDRPDYVIYDTMTPWGLLAAQALKIPAVATCPTLAMLPEWAPPTAALLLAQGISALARNVRSLRRRAELTAETARCFGVDRLRLANVLTNPAACTIVFTSERFQVRRERLDPRFHFVGATLSEPDDPTFPLATLDGKRVLYGSLGTAFNGNAAFFRALLAAFDGADDLVVIGAGNRTDLSALGPIPANCIVRPHVPQLAVLERAALFVTHGGMSSISGALWHEVPMLVCPRGGDQFVNARRVEKLRVGRRLRHGDLTPKRIRRLADDLVRDETVRRNLGELGRSLRDAGGASRAAEIVLRFVESTRGSREPSTAGSSLTVPPASLPTPSSSVQPPA
jgi:MGT family glycosyltransferase